MKTGIIYRATSIANGKCYVGQTTRTLKRRRQSHEHRARKGSALPFHAALRKYGPADFHWQVLDVLAIDKLDDAETLYIAQHRSHEKRHGYNVAMTGGHKTALGRKLGPFSEEHRRKISEAHKGKQVDPDHLRKLHEGRRQWTPDEAFKLAMSKAHKGRKHTSAARLNMSAGQKGRVFTDEHRRNLSEAHKGKSGRRLSDEAKQRIREKLKGHPVSKETREKIGAALKRLREAAA